MTSPATALRIAPRRAVGGGPTCGLCGATGAVAAAVAGFRFLECSACGFVWTCDAPAVLVAAHCARAASLAASSSAALLGSALEASRAASLVAFDLGAANPDVPPWLGRAGYRTVALDVAPCAPSAAPLPNALSRLFTILRAEALLLLHAGQGAPEVARCNRWWYVTARREGSVAFSVRLEAAA